MEENIIVCGVLVENGEYTSIKCNVDTGECFFDDPVMGYPRLVSEVSIDSPMPVDVSQLISSLKAGNYGSCIGVILDGEHVLKLLNDSQATRVAWNAPESVGAIFSIDIYGDYEEE